MRSKPILQEKIITAMIKGSDNCRLAWNAWLLLNSRLKEEKFQSYFGEHFYRMHLKYALDENGAIILFYAMLFYRAPGDKFTARAIVGMKPELRGNGLFDFNVFTKMAARFYLEHQCEFPVALYILNPMIYVEIYQRIKNFAPKPADWLLAFVKKYSPQQLVELGRREITQNGYPPFVVKAPMTIEWNQADLDRLYRRAEIDIYMKVYFYLNPWFVEGDAVLLTIQAGSWLLDHKTY